LFLFPSSLFNLYNLLVNPYNQFQIYMKALTLALNGKVTEYIAPSFKKMDSFLKEWNIGISDQRELFLAISNVLKENKRYEGKGFSHTKVKLVVYINWTGHGVGLQVYY
jgi:translation initiation factor 3 subunit M